MTVSHSPQFRRGRRLRTGLYLATGSLALVVLSGCTAASTPAASATGSPSATSSRTPPAPSATAATPTPTATPAGTPVTLSCAQVLTPDDVYAFNPNYGAAPNFTPSKDATRTAASYRGLTCGLLNQTSGEMIEYSVTQPNEALMSSLKGQAIRGSQSAPGYGAPPAVTGYFTTRGGTGEAQAFTPTYWVTLSSPVFGEAGDAGQLMSAALSHLK